LVAGRYSDRIRIVRNPRNLGIVENFNRAVSLTSGDYIAFLGADNRFRSDYVEKCKYALDTNPDAAVAYTNMVLFGRRAAIKAGKINAMALTVNSDMFLWNVPPFNEETAKILERGNFIHGSSMYRRVAFEEAGGYIDSGNHEDHDLFLRMIRKGWRAVLVPEYLLEYREHSPEQRNNMLNIMMELDYLRRTCREYENKIRSLNILTSKTRMLTDALYKILKLISTERITSGALTGIGEILLEMGQTASAEVFIKKALKSDPDNLDALNDLGVISFVKGDTETARKYFLEVLSKDDTHEEARRNLMRLESQSVTQV